MIPDIDAIHTWNEEFPINWLWETGAAPNFPRVRIDPLNGLPGFHALPEGEDRRDTPIARPLIEIPRQSYRQGKSLVYSGWLEARNEPDLDQLEDSMTSAFQSMDAGQMVIEQFSTGEKYLYTARCTALSIDGNAPSSMRRMTNGYERTFVLSLRMLDGRFYKFEEETAIASSGPMNTVEVNAGSAPVDPVFTIGGPTSGGSPSLINTSSGRALVMTTEVAAGQIRTVDFAQRAIFNNVGVDVTDSVLDSDQTDWWDRGVHGLIPESNTVALDGGAGPSMSLRWRKAYFA